MAEIVINNFKAGVAPSPHEGFADMRNVILDGVSGAVEIGWQTVRVASTAISDQIKAFAVEKRNTGASAPKIYAASVDGEILESTNSGATWTELFTLDGVTDAIDAEIWKDYLIITENSTINYYGPISGSAILYNNQDSFQKTDTRFHPIIVGQDDIVYIGDANQIVSIQEVSGSDFHPGTASTYTINKNALDLPEDYRVKCFGELGTNLMVGTWVGNQSDRIKVADIFPWDRTSDSFSLPIRLSKNGVHAMINDENLLYFMAGVEGELFVTNGISVKKLTQIPKHLTQVLTTFIDAYPNNIMVHKNKIYFAGKSSETGGANSAVPDGIGVWSFDPITNALVMENQIDTGSTGAGDVGSTSNEVNITALKSLGYNSYLIAYEDEGSPDINGIDLVSDTQRYTSYAARIDSQFFQASGRNKPASFHELEFELAKPLLTGQGIRFSYRTDLRSDFTSIRTFDFATDGGIQNGNTDFILTTETGVQIRTEMTTAANSTTTVELLSVTIR